MSGAFKVRELKGASNEGLEAAIRAALALAPGPPAWFEVERIGGGSDAGGVRFEVTLRAGFAV